MFNLLPEQQKKNLDKEYSLRKYYIILCFAVVSLIAAAVFMLPSYIKARMVHSEAELKKSQLETAVGTQNQVSLAALQELKAETNALRVASGTPMSLLLQSVILDIPSGVHIKEFQYEEAVSNILVISGTAVTRTALLSFSNNLKQDTGFSNVDLPIESLAADRNASFNIRLTVK